MATIERYCQYPIINATLRQVGGQNVFKQYIKDLDTLLTDIGLLRTALDDQLNVNDIPDLDVSLCFTAIGSVWSYNTAQSVFYNPIEYTFDDELSPIKIKFEFFFFRHIRRSSIDPLEPVPFGCKITVTTNGSSQVIWQHLFVNRTSVGNTDFTYPMNTLCTLANNNKSMVCYDKEKGYLYLNYCPNARYNIMVSGKEPPTASHIWLCVSRSRDQFGAPNNSYVRALSPIAYTFIDTSGYGYNNANGVQYTLNRDGFYAYIISHEANIAVFESSVQLQAPHNMQSYYNNGNYYTFMSTAFNTKEKIPEYDPFILIGNKVMTSAVSEIIYSIKINENEAKNYVAISQNDTGGYPYHTNQCLLMYYN